MQRGLVALGDSITRGRGGAPALGVHPQSWAQWLAEALDLPFSNFAEDGEVAVGLVKRQLPRLQGPYDLATLYIGANDARGLRFDAEAYERCVDTALATLARHADRTLVLTLPLDLGRPRAGQDVVAANGALRRLAARHQAILCPLEDFKGARLVLPDAVHPTSPGMVEMAERAAAALAAAGVDVPRRPRELADEMTHPVARARYGAWWGWQLARDRRRQLVERWQYRQRPR
jgi:lysophospholipase L1-like esterase